MSIGLFDSGAPERSAPKVHNIAPEGIHGFAVSRTA
jgi:hypothetical protein